jgi:hypothetical protein
MKKTHTLILLLAFLMPVLSYAQQDERQNRRKEEFEKIQKERVEYIAKAMNLKDEEAKIFWPLCFEFWEKKFEADRLFRRKIHQFMQAEREGQAHTENDYRQIVEIFAEKKLKEAELDVEYMKKFLAVLPAEKVFRFQGAEQDFLREMLNRHRGSPPPDK